MKSITGDEGSEITLTENTFTKTGYTFAEWNTSKDGSEKVYVDKAKIKLTANTTLYAQWTVSDYKITYNLDGGTNAEGNPDGYNAETETITLQSPTKNGYTFAGWYKDSKFENKVTEIANGSTRDVTLYAKWTANTYTVKFDKNANDATDDVPADISATYDVEFALPENTFTKIGYNFAGWNTEADGNGTNYANKANVKNLTTENGATVTLYAKWTANNYTVSFDANGGTGSMITQTFTYGTPQALNENEFIKTGYEFAGWATSANGNVTYKDNQDYSIGTENVTLYAIWRDIISFKKIQTDSINGSETWTPASKVFVSGRALNIEAFYISDHEVTRREYKEIMGSDPSTAKAYDKDGNKLTGTAVDNNPVNCVNWYDAIVYCNKRSIKEGLTPCYKINGSTDPNNWGTIPTEGNDEKWDAATCDWKANGYRLPTEAEWEWAARGGKNYTYAGSNDIDEVAWYYNNTNGTGTREVKTKNANGYGLYDMSGNVWEWCWDWYGSISSSTHEAAASSESKRCQRGGCWISYGDNGCEVADRNCYSSSRRDDYYGLRVVRTAE